MDSGLKQSGQCKQILLISFNHQLHSHVPLNKIKKLEGAWFPLRPWFDCYLTEHSWPKEWGHLAARFGTRLKSAILKCHIAGSGRIQQESKQSRLFGRKSQNFAFLSRNPRSQAKVLNLWPRKHLRLRLKKDLAGELLKLLKKPYSNSNEFVSKDVLEWLHHTI